MNIKRFTGTLMMSSVLLGPFFAGTVVAYADDFYNNQTNAERADITNWVASTPEQISSNISGQNIDVNNLNGQRYVIQWGDTLWGISQATGISVDKLAYDNNITNADLIYAGNVLILNKDGVVPTGFKYQGDPRNVAQTKVTINNFNDNSEHVVIVNSPVTIQDNSNNSYNPDEFKSPVDSSSSSDTSSVSSSNSSASSSQSSSTAKSSTKSTSSSSSSEVALDDNFLDEVSTQLKKQDDFKDEDVTFMDQSDDFDDDTTTNDLYDEDQTLDVTIKKLNTSTAKKVAKAIAEQLNQDDKLSDVKGADHVKLVLTKDGDQVKFNLVVESSDDSSSSQASEEDTDSSSSESSSSSEENESSDVNHSDTEEDED